MGPDELDELSGIIAIQSRELAELVEDLLVASRADFGNLSIKRQRHQPGSEQVEHGVDRCAERAEVAPRTWSSRVGTYLRIRRPVAGASDHPKSGHQRHQIRRGQRCCRIAVRGFATASVLVADNGVGVTEQRGGPHFRALLPECGVTYEAWIGRHRPRLSPDSLAEMMGGTLEYVV